MTELLQSVALAVLATGACTQAWLTHRAYRRLWTLEGDIGRLMTKTGLYTAHAPLRHQADEEQAP